MSSDSWRLCDRKVTSGVAQGFGFPFRNRRFASFTGDKRRVRLGGLDSCSLPAARREFFLWGLAIGASLLCWKVAAQASDEGISVTEILCDSMDESRSQASLVEHLKDYGRIECPRVERALLAVDRQHFLQRSLPKCIVYQDMPLPIGYGETISAPHMHATCLDILRHYLFRGARVLDVGSGSGYLSACMGLMVGQEGSILGVEKHPELARKSISNIRKSNPELLEGENPVVTIVAGNVLSGMLDEWGLFDAIHVGAAAKSLPEVLVNKLKPGGRMIIPVGPRDVYQELICVDKDPDGAVYTETLMSVRYVPLTEPQEGTVRSNNN
ncbi:hypothetical protein BSKO_07256 [Bryopsis sp. KO-2023]|nr:hypothetical protein BSKO_07256 [Bryopsis sp. KO-2023]